MVILDTNALIFDALDPGRLSRKACQLVEQTNTQNAVCCCEISLWEIVMLSTTFADSVSADPADRLIAASAVHHRAALITTDANLRRAGLPVAVFG